MLTDQEIQDLIRSPKEIKEKIPVGGYKEENGHRQPTDRYSTLEDALVVFFADVGVTNYSDYFSELIQGTLF